MRFDFPSLFLAAVILAVAALSRFGLVSEDFATACFILVPTLGFVSARRAVCRARGEGCAA